MADDPNIRGDADRQRINNVNQEHELRHWPNGRRGGKAFARQQKRWPRCLAAGGQMRSLVQMTAAAALIAGLAGCATYPYGYSGYGYERPYYYGYDSAPYPYGPYYYGYPSYGPYYYGAPAVGLSFGFSSGGHHH